MKLRHAFLPAALAAAFCAPRPAFAGSGSVASAALRAAPQRQDYLSEEEADKIRDAETPSDRIKLFLSFADDRLQEFQYEISRKEPEGRRDEILNGLLNAYVGCVDDAADLVDEAQQKQQDVRAAVKLMKEKTTGYLAALKKIQQEGPELETYRYSLEDAIDGTEEALNDAKDSEKSALPAPVRRKQP